MKPLKKILGLTRSGTGKADKELVLTLSEIDAITEKLVSRVEQKIKTLKALNAEADQKIAILDGLITKYKSLASPSPVEAPAGERHSQGEVRVLAGKGFGADQIARILDLPLGEVELILNLGR
jgi:hypothetical protein